MTARSRCGAEDASAVGVLPLVDTGSVESSLCGRSADTARGGAIPVGGDELAHHVVERL